MLIFDALLFDGGVSKKYIDSCSELRYSEHAGLINFNNNKLEKIIISGNTNREDCYDWDILLPNNIDDIKEYEYIFHTHPPTPCPGGRINDGILYEFPSLNDIYYFIDKFNKGIIQGSIIIAPEGVYIIKTKNNINKIKYDINKELLINNLLQNKISKIQFEAIEKYKIKFTSSYYYEYIIQDKKYIKKFNILLNKFFNNQIKIIYKQRKYDKLTDNWIIKNLYIPIK